MLGQVARGGDAVRALEAGFKSIWVSNHGGRQLEDSVATFDVLPEVRAAVGPDVEVILDGGVRRGLDIVKGLARGADSGAVDQFGETALEFAEKEGHAEVAALLRGPA